MARIGRPPQDPARRAHRILDVAAELIVRWGHDKTTIDDVASRAGVAKGTIYLHWRTREELFAALLRRERVRLFEELRASEPATPSELFGGFVATAMRRPLMRAIMAGDPDVLGRHARTMPRSSLGLRLGGAFDAYLRKLIDLGAVRAEPGDHLTVVTAIVYGFVFLPEEARPPVDRLGELVTDTIERAMTTGRPLPEQDARTVAQETLGLLDTMIEAARDKLAASLPSTEGTP